jgi:N-methylhydantoinase B/oxoprolinase/acetone carboxylase alpha subunit
VPWKYESKREVCKVKDLDPITREIVGNALVSISREMGLVMKRTSYSSILNEGRDFSCAIFDAGGNLSATAEFVMVHLGAMGASVEAALHEVGIENLETGDIAVLNDPYKGGSHLPDVTMVRPVIFDEELIAFVGNRAHYPDVGGMAPGSFAGDSTEIFQEGLIIPPLVLFKHDKPDEQLFKLIFNNVRSPRRWRGDSSAQVASLRIGEKRLLELIDKWGKDTVVQSMRGLMDQSYDLTKSRIRELPDGEYKFFDFMDDFSPDGELVKFYLNMKVKGDRLIFDFTGTDRQIERPINCPIAVTRASVYAACKSVIAPEAIVNAGFFNALDFVTEEETLVDAVFPAPVCGGNTNSSQRILDLVLACFAHIYPERIIGAEYAANSDCTLGGFDNRYHENYVIYLMPVGGIGARATKDGIDGLINYVGNVSNQPIEVFEHVLPFRYSAYSLRNGSGGAGKYRGGLGEMLEFSPVDNVCIMSIFTERVQIPPFGVFGGSSASPARYIITRLDGKKQHVEYKTSRIRLLDGERFTILTPGGGGYGDPFDRDTITVLEDYLDDLITLEDAEERYGVRIDPVSCEIDEEETRRIRKNRSNFIELVINDIIQDGYSIVLSDLYRDHGFCEGDLAEVSAGVVPLRGWISFDGGLHDEEIRLSNVYSETLNVQKGQKVLCRRVGRRLARVTFSEDGEAVS